MLSLLVILFSVIPAFSAVDEKIAVEPLQTTYDNELNKLHFYFDLENTENQTGSAIARTSSSENSVDDDYFTYIDTENELDSAVENMNAYYEKHADENELIQVTVEFKSNFENTEEYISFSEEKKTVKTLEEVREFREKLAAFSKEYHKNEAMSKLEELSSLDYSSIELIDYSPFVRLTINRDKISTESLLGLANSEEIANVSFVLKDEICNQATWDRTMREIEAYSTINSSLYTGEGIRVGVLELAVCEPTHTNLTGKSITIQPGYNNDTLVLENDEDGRKKSDYIAHANAVTSIIALMAPDAEIYASRNTSNGMSWFIESGCDIVNCSFSRYIPTAKGSDGTYGYNDAEYMYYFDGLIDYQIKTHYISVVAAAGNIVTDNEEPSYNPMKQIRSPGLAHNVITVGGLNCTLGFLDYDLEYHDSACYVTTTSRTKPEISALFTVDIPNVGTKSGTSFSAPQVTGSIALIMCKYAASALNPHAVKAMLISGANKTEEFSNISGSYFDDKVGAGCVSLLNLRNSKCITYMGSNNSESHINNYVYTYNVTLSKNDVLQNGISWYADVDYQNEICKISNFDIHIFDSSDNLVCTSSLGNFSNSEFVRYTAPSVGTYKIKVYQNGALPNGIEDEPFAFVCNIL